MLITRNQLHHLAEVKWRSKSVQPCSWDFRNLDITI